MFQTRVVFAHNSTLWRKVVWKPDRNSFLSSFFIQKTKDNRTTHKKQSKDLKEMLKLLKLVISPIEQFQPNKQT